ncbi:micrococcal nuclease [Haladaptatus litoreus]|uniref:Micrococcal nuclease n=1 Tax=Haladaptatus litoreus TaxID=553468 RepID=A0A1N7E223_9EURY|nr:lamin tail domain-containing protein [Haladaptatus litoreus]SIR82172.1 micrococcal nuclease [Haladaptatus litoreus]
MSVKSSLLVLVVVSAVVLAGCSSVPSPTTQTNTPADETDEAGAGETIAGETTGEAWTVTITRIVDGDTVEFEYRNGTQETARLLGVDTPEVHTANDPEEFEGVSNDESGATCLRDWGHKASEFARSELADEQVTISFDPNEGPRDRYDRLLVYIHDDGKSFNYQLVKQGYARVYDSEFEQRERFYSAESEAQQGNVGLWECRDGSGSSRTTENTGGKTDFTIAQIHADAEGNDHENLNDEYIVLRNGGTDALDISGWSISDDSGHTYRVPSGISLESGATVTLYTGSGSDSAAELYWGSDSAVWNNGGDTIIVRNESGDVVLREEYSG